MQEITIKKDNNITLEKDIKLFLNPIFVFLPIKDNFKLKVTDNEYVYKNDIIAMDNLGHIIYSSVSGKVLGVKDMIYTNGRIIPSVVIENDLKENIRTRKNARKFINDYNKKEFFDTILDLSLFYRGQYLIDKLKCEYKSLIINAIDKEPYFMNKSYVFKNSVEDMLETIDIIGSILNIDQITITLKNNESDLIQKITDSLGTYPNMELKLLNDSYSNGLNEILKNILNKKDALVLDIEEIKMIYDALKRQIPTTERLITITGEEVNPRNVIKVKYGSLLSEIFINNADFTTDQVDVYLNGEIGGKLVKSLKIVVDETVDGLLIMKKRIKDVNNCINCGLCSKSCPMGLNPKHVFDKNGKVKREYYESCLSCGICNYVCPSNIDLRSYMKRSDDS